MTPSEYILQLAQALTREEDLTDREAQDILYEFALRILQLLLAELPGPADGLARMLTWQNTLRPFLLQELQRVVDRLYQLLTPHLDATEFNLVALHTRLFSLPKGALLVRSTPEILASATVLQRPVAQLMERSAATRPSGISPLTMQLFGLLERPIMAGLMRNDTTSAIAQSVVGIRVQQGNARPVVRKGTVANAWRHRYRAVTAAALWSLVAVTQSRAAAVSNLPIRYWQWQAVLDPVTCPVCRELDGSTAETLGAFRYGPPPQHPNCRCIAVPRFAVPAPVN